MISESAFNTTFKVIMGFYGTQMLLMPAKMVTDHFNDPATDMLKFWIRGSSVSFFGLLYAMSKIEDPTEVAKIGTVVSAAVGILYPWNAKFGYISENLPVKYPMHYVPEVLLTGLTAAGILALMN